MRREVGEVWESPMQAGAPVKKEDGWLGGSIPDQQSREGLARLRQGKEKGGSVSLRGVLRVQGTQL